MDADTLEYWIVMVEDRAYFLDQTSGLELAKAKEQDLFLWRGVDLTGAPLYVEPALVSTMLYSTPAQRVRDRELAAVLRQINELAEPEERKPWET